jgi:type IV pilus assembly protein PilM
MAAVRGVWAIDIGTTSLKALRVCQGENGLQVIGFSHIEHSRPLTAEGVGMVERDQIVSETLREFLDENDIGKEEVGILIAGQNSFSRFIKLPPVEPKKIPEIVQFEAVQQIPFDINEVEWDWQLMENENSPDKEVGLFAIKNEVISEVMDHFTKENLRVTCVQIAPMALYNFACYDLKEVSESKNQATIILDMGADNTTLVICTKDSVWQRSIRIGGNTFTQAISDTFRKDFRTAEKLKRTAPMSKYMRQIYTAMKPIYTDLGGEIQRSLGFYSSSPQGRDKTFSKMIALGGGMKLQGLAKYLTQTLGMPVVKPDSFEHLELSPDISSAKFHENVSDFGVVYGLGAQLLGSAKISTNLLPRRIARAMAWTRKSRMFTIAASVLLLVMVLGLAKAFKDLKQYQSHAAAATRTEIKSAIDQVNAVKAQKAEQEGREQPLLDRIEKEKGRFEYREVLPEFNVMLIKCLPNPENTPAQADLYEAFASGNVQAVRAVPRRQRKQLFVTNIAVDYTDDIATAGFPQTNQQTGFSRTARRAQAAPDAMFMRDDFPGRFPGPSSPSPAAVDPAAGQPGREGGAGFTVLIEGYSPYQPISELLDPLMAGNDLDRWGVVTRFENIEKLFPDMPYKLFNKHEIAHFKVETGLVDLIAPAANMPAGIGVEKVIERVPQPEPAAAGRQGAGTATRWNPNTRGTSGDFVTSETVLVDPMTGEEISKTYDIITQEDLDANPDLTERDLGKKKWDNFGNEQYIERDRWFRIQAKFIWTEAPAVAPSAAGTPQDMIYGR